MNLPDPQFLTEERLAQALRDLHLGSELSRRGYVDRVAALCRAVTRVPGEPVPTWEVSGERARHRGERPDHPVDATSLVCSCGGQRCPHVGAILVVLAYNDPDRGAALRAPTWEVALAPLAPRPRPRGRAHDGHIRYVVHPPRPGLPGLDLEPRIIRLAREDGRPLAPVRMPRSLSAVEEQLRGVTEADREIHPAWCALDRARRLEKSGRVEASRHLSRAILGPLSRALDVRLGDTPVRVSTEAVRPTLVARRTADRGLALTFEPALRLHWGDAGIVLTHEGVLRPLADDVRDEVAERLLDPLPTIAPAEVQAFVDRLVVGRGLEVALPPDVVVVHPADARVARLSLAEVADHALQIRLDLVYERHGTEITVAPGAPGETVVVPEAGAVRRDLPWEEATLARFHRDLGCADDHVRLPFVEALDFLRHRLPELAATWQVFGHDRLVRFQVRGTLAPSVRFRDGEDWFDLDVGFELGGRRIRAAQVLKSWLEGKRYTRLDDGSLARLPMQWLRRHGARVDALAEVRRAQRQLGTWHAWMASELLHDEVGARAGRWVDWVDRMRRVSGLALRDPGEGFVGTLRPYQQHGLTWLLFLHDHQLHGLLADEMGLGKTVQALAAIATTGGPALVVAPTSVLHGWRAEAARFAPSLRCVVWHGARDPAALDAADLVVTSWSLLRRDIDTLAARRWRWAVLDEGQAIKNPASATARAARKLQAHTRVVLTGTPLQNDLTELWSLFAYLLPGYLGRRVDFHARYTRASRHGDEVGLDDLTRRIQPFFLRRRKAEVAPELPPLTTSVLRIPLSDRERALYDSVRLTVHERLEEARGDDRREHAHLVLEGLTRLRQACCHPALLPFPEARRVSRSSKVEALLDLLVEAAAAGRRSLVFSQWVRLLDQVADGLDRRGLGYLRLQGDTRDRAGVVAAFQVEDGPPVMLISLKAGGTGLNLTAADTVFHLDPWWNPQAEAQATDRAHRIGQERPVTAYRLVAADTVEERVLALQDRKRALFAATVERAASDLSRLTAAELEQLLAT